MLPLIVWIQVPLTISHPGTPLAHFGTSYSHGEPISSAEPTDSPRLKRLWYCS